MSALKRFFSKYRAKPRVYANEKIIEKANITVERYREIISDPINILIDKVPNAGYVDGNRCVILHNGHRVAVEGDLAYYREFSDILIINRGIHEPLEEYCFQETLKKIKSSVPRMIELGAYWAHYSMWFKKQFPTAECIMVEPDETNLACGMNNFRLNSYQGEFIKSFVGKDSFQLDAFASQRKLERLDILHSDIQGYELEMLDGARTFLGEKRADYVFVSTHSQDLHLSVEQKLRDSGYRIEVSVDFANETTSLDGFILASSPDVEPVFEKFSPMGRVDILNSTPHRLVSYLASFPTSASGG